MVGTGERGERGWKEGGIPHSNEVGYGALCWIVDDEKFASLELNQGGSSSCEPMMALASVVRISHSFGITF